MGGQAIVSSGGRVYVFGESNTTFDQQRHIRPQDFEAVLAAVKLEPGRVPAHDPPTVLGATFVSTLNGFSIRYPSSWTAIPGSSDGSPDSDVDRLERGFISLSLDSVLAPRAHREIDRLRSYCSSALYLGPGPGRGVCNPGHWPRIRVGSAMGWLVIPLGAEPGDSLQRAVAFAGDRMYVIAMSGAADEEFFADLLRSVRLEPKAATGR